MAAKNKSPVQQNQTPSWWQQLKDNVYNHYQGIIDKIKSPFVGLSNYFYQKENQDSLELNALREKHYKLIQEEGKKATPDYPNVTRLISADTKTFMQKIIDQEVKKLGTPPCEFTTFTLGSMAREECGPITDLEIGFLIKEKTMENYKYFQQLSQKISDRLFLLGEHPDIGGKGLRMDEADNAPIHRRFWARNLTTEQAHQLQNEAIKKRDWKQMPYEGSRPYLTTYDEFAQFSQPDFSQDKKAQRQLVRAAFENEWEKAQRDPRNKNKLKTLDGQRELRREIDYWVNQMHGPLNNREINIANTAGKKLGRNMAFLYGNKANYDALVNKKNKIFEQKENGISGRKVIAKEKMREDISDIIQKGKSPYVTGKLDKTLDIKREFYRFVEQFVTNLGFYHHCKSQNCMDIVNELVNRNVLSPEFGNQLQDFIKFTTGLRLKEQVILKRQGFATYLDQEEFNDDKTKLEKEIKLLEDSIQYMESIPKAPVDPINLKKRALVDLKDKYDHLLDMAPGKIIAAADLALLKSKYVPFAHEIFEHAKKWTQGVEKLGFTQPSSVAAPVAKPTPAVVAPVLSNDKAQQIDNLVENIKANPKRYLPAMGLALAKMNNIDKPVAEAFVKKCQEKGVKISPKLNKLLKV